jgi:hypothetical protein
MVPPYTKREEEREREREREREKALSVSYLWHAWEHVSAHTPCCHEDLSMLLLTSPHPPIQMPNDCLTSNISFIVPWKWLSNAHTVSMFLTFLLHHMVHNLSTLSVVLPLFVSLSLSLLPICPISLSLSISLTLVVRGALPLDSVLGLFFFAPY